MSGYRGQCIGRLMHFLFNYSWQSDHWIFVSDGKTITDGHNGPVVATYTWDDDGDSDVPTFTFFGKYSYLNDIQEDKKEDLLRIEGLSDRKPWSKKC